MREGYPYQTHTHNNKVKDNAYIDRHRHMHVFFPKELTTTTALVINVNLIIIKNYYYYYYYFLKVCRKPKS